jgi:hypothetical protein
MDNLFTPTDPTTIPENAYEVLVGEDKKYKDNEALARSKMESDNFIRNLQRELKELRDASSKAATLEEVRTTLLAELKASKDTSLVQPPVTPPEPDDNPDIETIVSTLLEKKDQERRRMSNQEKVTKTLQDRFGEDAQAHLSQKAKELSVSLDYLAKVANESPEAFFRLVGIDAPKTATGLPAPRPTQAAPLPQGGVRNKSYYDKLKASNPTDYFSQKTQMQMYKDWMAQGETFNS